MLCQCLVLFFGRRTELSHMLKAFLCYVRSVRQHRSMTLRLGLFGPRRHRQTQTPTPTPITHLQEPNTTQKQNTSASASPSPSTRASTHPHTHTFKSQSAGITGGAEPKHNAERIYATSLPIIVYPAFSGRTSPSQFPVTLSSRCHA